MASQFKLPIEYQKKTHILQNNIIDDLELITTQPNENEEKNTPIFHTIFEPTNIHETQVVEQISKYYTNDTKFLKDNQTMLKTNDFDEYLLDNSELSCCSEIFQDNNFINKYSYIDIKYFSFLNNSQWFLQFISIINLLSPVFSLIAPIIGLIVPYFVMRFKGVVIPIEQYYNFMKMLIFEQGMGKLIFNFSKLTLQNQMYTAFTVIMYIFQIYNNIKYCFKFKSNMNNMCGYLDDISCYLDNALLNIQQYKSSIQNIKSFQPFLNDLEENEKILLEYRDFITDSPKKWTISNLLDIGYTMKCFYVFYNEENIKNAIDYSVSFNSYLKMLRHLKNKVKSKQLNYGKYNKKNKVSMKKTYYANIEKGKAVKNDISLDKNLIITGPNASGKTTIIKSVQINVILLQQMGVGFFESASIHPYHSLFCYLNIPDTSARDSLFQAEARRCLDIVNYIKEHPTHRIFCIFDELYSGTNPEEAIASAYAFIHYLCENKIDFLLTTHFTQLCKSLESIKSNENNKSNENDKSNENNKRIKNCKMEIETTDDGFKYMYKVDDGISNIRGAVKVLKDLNYPSDILEKTNKYLMSYNN